jgi:hypothetical protein
MDISESRPMHTIRRQANIAAMLDGSFVVVKLSVNESNNMVMADTSHHTTLLDALHVAGQWLQTRATDKL